MNDEATMIEPPQTKGQKTHGNKEGTMKALKTTKQCVLMEYLFKIKVDNEEVEKINAKQLSNEDFYEFERKHEVQNVLLSLIGRIEKSCGNIDMPCYIHLHCINVHSTWEFRALVIAFWIHPYFGCRNYELSGRIFGINENTLRTWVIILDVGITNYQVAFLVSMKTL